MHFAAELLQSLTEAELEDTINWCRTREKDYRRRQLFGLAYFWRSLNTAVVEEYGRRCADSYADPDQLVLEGMPGRVSPEARRSPART